VTASAQRQLTADTITDEQIRAGYQAGLIGYSLLEFATFPAWNDPMTRPYYRGRCAEILNAVADQEST
jgi:hypothetical protein